MTFSEELASAIADWLSAKGRRSVQMLSRLSTVSNSTIRRAMQKECMPSQENTFLIASVVMNRQDFNDFVSRHWPHLKEYIVDSGYRSSNNDDLLHLIRSEKHCKIIVLASSLDGTDHHEVAKKFGESALEFLDDLIDLKVLTKKGQKWIFDENFGSMSFEVARDILSNFISMCERKNDYIKGLSSSWVGWESVSPSIAKKINALSCRYCQDVGNLITDPENRGDVLVYTGIISNVLKGQEYVHE